MACGAWEKEVTESALHIESSPSLHYGQQAFEGLKPTVHKRWKRPIVPSNQNAKRFATYSRSFVDASKVPTDMFVWIVRQW